MILILALIPIALSIGVLKASGAAKSDADTMRAMEILRANCLACHSDDKHKAGLRLTSRASALKGGDIGPVIVPRKPDGSLLAKAILPDADPHMPPKKQLSDRDIGSLKQWIAGGAKWDEKVLLEPTVEKPIHFVSMPSGYQPVLALALSSDEQLLAVGRANHIYIHNLALTNHPIIHDFDGHRDAVQSLAWSPDGKHLASGDFKHIVVWNLDQTDKKSEYTNNLVGRITSLKFTTNGQTIVASDGVPTKNGLVHFISLNDQKSQTIEAHKDSIYCVRISPDGKVLATAGADKLAKLWDFETHKEISKYEAHMGYVLSLAFNADGSRLATGGADKVVNIWDVKTGKQEIVINKHPAPVSALAWSDDSKKLFSACEDGAVRLFTDFKTHSGSESSDGAQERTFTNMGETLYTLAATADGKKVFAGSHNGTVYCWNSDGKLLEKFESPVMREELAANTTALK